MTPITAPYSAQALETVRQTHRQDSWATLTPAVGDPIELAVAGGTVTFSEDWSPHIQAQLSCANTHTVDQLLAMDPRQAPVLQVFAGYSYPGQADDVQLLATTVLVERRVVVPGDTLELVASSAESLAQDVAWLEGDQTRTWAGIKEALDDLLAYAGAISSSGSGALPGLDTTLPNNFRADLTASVPLKRGQTIWTVVQNLAAQAGLWLHVSADGVWHLDEKVRLAGETSAWLSQGGGGSIVTKADDVLSRNGYYSAAVVRYSWEDATGSHEVVGTWAPDPLAGEPRGGGQKCLVLERTGRATQYQADETARLAVRAVSTRGDSYTLEAVACYWLRPGATVQIDLANGSTARHIVKQVDFHLGEGSMTVTTREPTNLGEDTA